jgi:hypothetical protein
MFKFLYRAKKLENIILLYTQRWIPGANKNFCDWKELPKLSNEVEGTTFICRKVWHEKMADSQISESTTPNNICSCSSECAQQEHEKKRKRMNDSIIMYYFFLHGPGGGR